jgi:glyceraldehyde-3-phosphate dehydrogenase/erythrose-4-phosphate dehydrogenase
MTSINVYYTVFGVQVGEWREGKDFSHYSIPNRPEEQYFGGLANDFSHKIPYGVLELYDKGKKEVIVIRKANTAALVPIMKELEEEFGIRKAG